MGPWVFTNSRNGNFPQGQVPGLLSSGNSEHYLVANIARSEEKVAASSLRALSSLRSFIMVSVTMAFSFSYLLFRLARATSAVCGVRVVKDRQTRCQEGSAALVSTADQGSSQPWAPETQPLPTAPR